MENKQKTTDHFTGYEEARRTKQTTTTTKPITKKALKAATKRINPDEDTQDRG